MQSLAVALLLLSSYVRLAVPKDNNSDEKAVSKSVEFSDQELDELERTLCK